MYRLDDLLRTSCSWADVHLETKSSRELLYDGMTNELKGVRKETFMAELKYQSWNKPGLRQPMSW
jgi:hypothetical protein